MLFIPHHISLFFLFELLMVLMSYIMVNLLHKSHILAQQTKRIKSTENIINNLRKNFDIKEIKDFAVNSIALELKADRCILAEYDPTTKKFSKINAEYLSMPYIKTMTKGLPPIAITRLTSACINNQVETIPNVEKFIKQNHLENSLLESFYKNYEIKSTYFFPIRYSGTMVGIIALNFCRKTVALNKADINFVVNLTESIAVAINQAELYDRQNKTIEREQLLGKIVKIIRSSLDSKQIQQTIVNQIGLALKAQRCVLATFDKLNNRFDFAAEYLQSLDVKSFSTIQVDSNLPNLKKRMLAKEDVIVRNAKDYLIENNLENTEVKAHFEEYKIESGFAIPITYFEKLLGMLIIHYESPDVKIAEEELNFVKTLADQIGIAIYQADLYETQKKIAQKEKVLRSFVTAIRESLDIEQIKHKVVTEIGKLFTVERVMIAEYDNTTQKYLPVTKSSEYLAPETTKSLAGEDLNVFKKSKFLQTARELRLDLIHPNLKEFLSQKDDSDSEIKDFFEKYDIESSIVLNVEYAGEFLGNLIIHYSASKHPLSEEEIDYARTIANQIAIAIYQSKLFKNVQQQAKKENILRQIISKIKFTKNLEGAYNKLLEEIAQIYDLKRVLFLESSFQNTNELIIKYEYIDKKNHSCGNNMVFPQVCIDDFLRLINNFDTLVINNLAECYPDEQTLAFFRKYNIQSLLAVPLIKYNGETQVFGFIILCGENVREWSVYEIKLLEAISESVISVLWEIAKFIEVEDLRNSFILTLAHDFQVPLIGERNALEYIIQYNKDKIGADAELLEEILANNKNIISLLDKSVDIYNYEAGKKVIAKQRVDINQTLKEVIGDIKSANISNNIKIEFKKVKENIIVNIDQMEMSKVFHTIIENAIEKSPQGSTVTIGTRKTDSKVTIYIKDEGGGISEEMQEKIFNRYEMALAIERKIGAGTGLFLAKRIIEAHKGSIYFETEAKKGTTFFVVLPLF